MSPAKPALADQVLALDVYGTLIDTAGITAALRPLVGEPAAEFAANWRSKQLEYTFRYGLMRVYRDFRVCTRQALRHCCAEFGVTLAQNGCAELMAKYNQLPAFADVLTGLDALRHAGVRMYAFSNGVPDDLAQLLEHAQISHYLSDVVSVDEVRSFKPDPKVYQHFLRRAQVEASAACLVSANPFDICGARAAGLNAVFLRRNPDTRFDPWEFTPQFEVATFGELVALCA